MKNLILICAWFSFLGTACSLQGQSLVQQWKQGLSGTKLTAFSGSVHSPNSTLTVVEFCGNGRYRYYKEGSWTVPGTAGGASNSTITGRWDVQQYQGQIYLTYRTDRGEQGSFPLYLTQNGKVSVGGTLFTAQQGAARCY
ncbi:MAG: hypothetical protein AAFR61_27250 [Bacteroidota bacterium]